MSYLSVGDIIPAGYLHLGIDIVQKPPASSAVSIIHNADINISIYI
jgi:hypothetical protein